MLVSLRQKMAHQLCNWRKQTRSICFSSTSIFRTCLENGSRSKFGRLKVATPKRVSLRLPQPMWALIHFRWCSTAIFANLSTRTGLSRWCWRTSSLVSRLRWIRLSKALEAGCPRQHTALPLGAAEKAKFATLA